MDYSKSRLPTVVRPHVLAPIVSGLLLIAGSRSTAWAGADVVMNSCWGIQAIGVGDPPDANGASGPRGILHVNNDRIQYLAKDGAPYYELQLGDFFAPATSPNSLIDPRGIYDPRSGRFFVTCSDFALTGGPNSALRAFLNVSVSTSSHPKSSSNWIKYRFDVTQVVGSGASEQHFAPDYPSIGIDAYALHVCANFFILPLDASTSFRNVGIMTFPKAQLLSGGAVSPLVTYLPAGVGFTLQPVSLLWSAAGPGNVSYFVETPPGNATGVRLWALLDPLGARTLSSTLIEVPNHGFTQGQFAPEGGTSVQIRSWSGMAQGVAQWRDGSIRFVATGDTSGPGISVDRTRVHYYDLAANGFPSGTPTLAEWGVIDGGLGVWNYLPSLSLTPRGDIGIGFQQSSASLTPRMMFTARPLGTLGFTPPRLVLASAQSSTFPDYTSGVAKWGDDYTASVDPADSSVWMTCELAQSPQSGASPLWIHEWANIVFDDDVPIWPSGGRRVRQGQTHVDGAALVGDDSAGVYLGWYDRRPLPIGASNVLGLRLLPTGGRAGGWPANGTFVGVSSFNGFDKLVADGSGGAYFVFGNYPVAAQRVGRAGVPTPGWPAAPVRLGNLSAAPLGASADGAGGLLVAYTTSGLNAQRIGPTGALSWNPPPEISASASEPDVIADASGGAYIGWVDDNFRVRVQHVLAAGSLDPAWPATGFDCGDGDLPRLVPDGAGGVFVAFGSAGGLLAWRLLPTGVPAPGWTSALTVCNAGGFQDQLAATSDGGGGMLIAWSDTRSAGSARDIYVQRVTGSAALAPGWTVNGVSLCTAPGNQSNPAIANDGTGGAVVVWTDNRSHPGCTGPACGGDCYGSRVTAAGVVELALGVNGAAISTAIGSQSNPSVALTESGVAIAAWLDGRSTPDGDPDYLTQVFAQRVAFDVTPPASVTDLAIHTTSCTAIALTWTAPGDDGGVGTAAQYDLRYSASAINSSNFSSATPLTTQAPRPAGSAESYTYEFGSCSGPIHAALKVRDDVGNVSGLSDLPPQISTWCPPPDCDVGVPVPLAALVDALEMPRPNPTSGKVGFDLAVSLASAGVPLNCSIYDVSGRLVRKLLADRAAPSGRRTLEWDLLDGAGRAVRSGQYFVRLKLGERLLSRSVTVN